MDRWRLHIATDSQPGASRALGPKVWAAGRRTRIALLSLLVVAALGVVPGTADAYVYWSLESGAIGRSNLDGTASDQSFITGLCLLGHESGRLLHGERHLSRTG